MQVRYWSVISIILIAMLVFPGCSKENPVDTGNMDEPYSQVQDMLEGHSLWGLYEVICDSLGDTEVLPLRTAQFNANVVKFLQPPASPVHMMAVSIAPGSDIASGFWVLDITLRHPFFEYSQFRGFDVRGIILTEGGAMGIHDPTVSYREDSGTRVINADGYTRWWNMMEFTSYNTILGYTEGDMSTPGFTATATVNPYKLFADSLDELAPLAALDPDSRATFGTMPGINKRRYRIQFDIDGGTTPVRFKYAIDASWSLPDPSYEPDFPVEAYDLSANCQEPYMLQVPIFEKIPYYENYSVYGGDAEFLLTVGDWQSESDETVLDQLDHIWIESPTLIDSPIDVLPTAEFVSSNHTTRTTYRITVPDCHPTGLENQKFFITAESSDPSSYAPAIQGDPYNFDWPEAHLAAYAVVDVPISPDGPPDPDSYWVVGLPDWCALTEHCTSGVDNLQLVTNLVEWDLEGPNNENMTVKWWGGKLSPHAPYSTSIIQSHVQSLGYTFVRTYETTFDPTDCRMIIVNFVRSGGAQYLPFSEEEIHEMKLFVEDGGVLCFLIENTNYFSPITFNPLMDSLGVPMQYGGSAEPPSDTTLATDITDHYVTTGVANFQYWTCGEFELQSDDCISLVRSPSGEHIVVLAPMDL